MIQNKFGASYNAKKLLNDKIMLFKPLPTKVGISQGAWEKCEKLPTGETGTSEQELDSIRL
jgi:hypothetical protein